MEVKEFERVLKLGLGRAILHLQQHSALPYREVILEACLHNISYDMQIEGGKSDYLIDVIGLTGETEFYRRAILDAARKIDYQDDSRDTAHIFDMVQCFAEQCDDEARQLLYDAFVATYQTENIWCSGRLIELDGLDGFLFVADKFGELALNDPNFEEDDYLLGTIKYQLGEDESSRKLAEARQENPRIDAYLKVAEEDRRQRKQDKEPNIRKLSYAELKTYLDTGVEVNLKGWGKFASDDDLRLAAADLLQETEPERLWNYLRIFSKRAFPLDHQPLFKLIDSEHERIPAATFSVLENISDPSVRDFALEHIRARKSIGRAVGLLENNFEAGDWDLIEGLTRLSLDAYEHHLLQMSVRDIAKQHPSKAAAPALLNLYEYAPCSFCRESIVKQLHDIDCLPPHIHHEALQDSNFDLRELAAAGYVEAD